MMRDSLPTQTLIPARQFDAVPAKQVEPDFPADCEVFLPEGYEPNYPYPLITWIGRVTPADRRLLEQLTERNCIAMSLGKADPETLFAAAAAARRRFHIHSERVILAGRGQDATAALQLMLDHPQQFTSGLVLALPMGDVRVSHFGCYRGHRLFASGNCPARTLFAAGIEMQFPHESEPLWSQVDAWIMSAIPSAWIA